MAQERSMVSTRQRARVRPWLSVPAAAQGIAGRKGIAGWADFTGQARRRHRWCIITHQPDHLRMIGTTHRAGVVVNRRQTGKTAQHGPRNDTPANILNANTPSLRNAARPQVAAYGAQDVSTPAAVRTRNSRLSVSRPSEALCARTERTDFRRWSRRA